MIRKRASPPITCALYSKSLSPRSRNCSYRLESIYDADEVCTKKRPPNERRRRERGGEGWGARERRAREIDRERRGRGAKRETERIVREEKRKREKREEVKALPYLRHSFLFSDALLVP